MKNFYKTFYQFNILQIYKRLLQISFSKKLILKIFVSPSQICYIFFLLLSLPAKSDIDAIKNSFSLSGITNFSYAYREDNKKNYSFGNDSQLFIKKDANFKESKFGATVKLETNFNSDNRNEIPLIDQAYLNFDSKIGKFEIGNIIAVNQKMKYDPSRIARGAGGINGKYLEHINISYFFNKKIENNNFMISDFIFLAQSPIGHGGYARGVYRYENDNYYNSKKIDNSHNYRSIKDNSFDGLEDALKLNYYTPRISGIQAGLSYTPKTSNNGVQKNISKYFNTNHYKNVFSYGINFLSNINNVGIALALTGENGKYDKSNFLLSQRRYNLSSYDLSATLSYFGFKFSLSNGLWKKSGLIKSDFYSCNNKCKNYSNSNYKSAGLIYQFGPLSLSLTAIRTNFLNNIYKAYSSGFDYKFNKHLTSYFEYTKFNFDSPINYKNDNTAIINNGGNIFLSGISYSF